MKIITFRSWLIYLKRKKTIDVTWIFKMKMNLDGKISNHKEMLVARDFLQKRGVDDNEVFAHVARL